MSLAGYDSGCQEDYIQFGRDILFLTTHKSRKFCGSIEKPSIKADGEMQSLKLITPHLAKRIYEEKEDSEMDIWVQINTRSNEIKTLTFVSIFNFFYE